MTLVEDVNLLNEKTSKTFQNEIKEIIQNIENENVADSVIIESIENFILDLDDRVSIIKFRSGFDNYSLLHYASKMCRYELSDYLITKIKINVDSLSKSKMTPLHVLIKTNIFEKNDNDQLPNFNREKFINTFGLLIQHESDYNLQDELGYTALHHAAFVNNYEACLMLINLSKINFLLEDEQNLTALHISCKNGHEEISSLLIEKTDIINLHSSSISLPIHFLCKFSKNEKIDLVKKMLDRLKNECYDEYKKVLTKQDNNKQTILNISIENNHFNVVDMLLKEYYLDENDLEDKNGNLPIHYCAKCGSVDILNVLWKNGAFSTRTNSRGDNPLHIAATNNKFKFIKSFLEYEKLYSIKIKQLQPSTTHMQPSVKCLNNNKNSPIFLAIIYGHVKCVEILALVDDVDLDSKDSNGNSIYHKCAELNHYESLRFLLTRKGNKYLEPIYIKNYNEETVLHMAARYESLEIIKLVLSKIYDGFMSTEIFLTAKNKQGQTFFHLACAKGYYNIVEYFLKDLKMHFFLEHQDNDLNTSLHLASQNGHLNIVNILIDYGIEINVKNKMNKSALELSCQRGYFEISKILISRYSEIKNEDNNMVDDPLHVACHEGAHEVVKLLLLKGAVIDSLNAEWKNCLDVAIEKEHREVIRVLLKHQNWKNLFQHTSAVYKKESPQINAMFEKKMWDMLKIVLDNCKNGDDYDFTILDPKFKNSSTHPLVLIAKSGQETLIKHETTKMLLNLKWRYTPRLVFYFNILFYLLFIILFSIYTIQLSKIFEENDDDDDDDENNNVNEHKNITSKMNVFGIIYFESSVVFYLIIVFLLTFIKKIFQILLIDGLAFFLSFPNWVELSTFAFAFISVLSIDYRTKFTFGSMAILLAYIEFSFLIQKFKVFGLYVLAFKRTLKNSAKFFPMFLLIFIGFILSFRLLSNFGVTYLNTNSGSYIIKILTMAVGELETNEMGLDEGLIVNYLIYTLFISIMCVIVLNLFVGIAVGEISVVLDEADIQQIAMRIMFVLKCQESMRPFIELPYLKKLNIRFEKYSYDKEHSIIRSKDSMFKFFKEAMSSKEPIIRLADPQKRLEDNLNELARNTNEDLKSLKEVLTNKINDATTKLSTAQQRLEDSLLENSIQNVNRLEMTKEESVNQIENLETILKNSHEQIENIFHDFYLTYLKQIKSMRQSFSSRFSNLEKSIIIQIKKLEHLIDHLFGRTNQLIISTNDEFRNLNHSINGLSQKTNDIQFQIEKINKDIETLLKLTSKKPTENKMPSTSNLSKLYVRESAEYSSIKSSNSKQSTTRKIEYECEEFCSQSLMPFSLSKKFEDNNKKE